MARKRFSIQQPEIDLLVAQAFSQDGGIGAVLGPRDLQAAVAQWQIVTRMKWDRALRPDNDGALAKRGQVVSFVGERCDTNRCRLELKEMVETRGDAVAITAGW